MKIEDLTLKEIKRICEEQSIDRCCTEDCPILETCCECCNGYPKEWTTEDMERDIEGVNK